MTFASPSFLIFIALFFMIWRFVKNHAVLSQSFLVLASLFFYGWWDWRFIFLILFSGAIDYIAALQMHRRESGRCFWLILSLVGNLGSLAIFKYSLFFAENLETSLAAMGMGIDLVSCIPAFVLILPVGISFYTFQSMSYSIDVYRREMPATQSVVKFFAYLTMFPQLVAGPIIRAKNMMTQIDQPTKLEQGDLYEGVKQVIYGFFKKLVIADGMAPFVNQAFQADTLTQGGAFWWLVMLAFAIQIYADFSGYSDIAIGLAKLMGFKFNDNFNHPYAATSLKNFWRRWHISLSTWFRDYVFIPLGGSKGTTFRLLMSLWVTFLLSGLWHGASWNFLIWGGCHALLLTVEKLCGLSDTFDKGSIMIRSVGWLLTLAWVLLAWVFFRAETLPQSLTVIENMLFFNGWGTIEFKPKIIIVGGLFVLYHVALMLQWKQCWLFENKKFEGFEPAWLGLTVASCLFLRGPGSDFIYFQF